LPKQWIRSLVIDEHHYIAYANGREELYHLTRDPWEQRNLKDVPEAQATLARARTELQAVIATLKAERDAGVSTKATR
jgi:hypothetical protein